MSTSWSALRTMKLSTSTLRYFANNINSAIFTSTGSTPAASAKVGSIILANNYFSSSATALAPGPHPIVPPDAEQRAKALRQKGDKAWKDAASVLIGAPNAEDKNKTDFLVMKRSKGSTTSPNTLCFPGGTLHPADCDRNWISWFLQCTGSELPDIDFLHPSAPQPPIYAKKKVEDFKDRTEFIKWLRIQLPPSVALRIAAIRETFEECGILLVRPNTVEEARNFVGREGKLGLGYLSGSHVIKDPEELESWQHRVRRDPNEFLTLCKQYLIRPDLNALVEWSNWLTPNSFGIKRFDTIFYMAILPRPLPFLSDAFEVATLRWTSADKVLQGAKDGKARLIPPQIYELTRLRNTSTTRIQQLMKMRLNLGIARWCPCYIKVKDGIMSVFPGDSLYPSDYKIEDFEEVRSLDQTLQEVHESTKNHHRITFKSEYEFQVVINIAPNLGHIYVD